MTNSKQPPEPFSLKRWSRRKLDSAQVQSLAPAPASIAVPATSADVPTLAPTSVDESPAPKQDGLPAVEGLTIDSDFAQFLKPEVAEDTRRAALKKLFSDPQFNVMDGLDTYVGDYTQPDPMPAGMLEKLAGVYSMVIEQEEALAADKARTASDAVVQTVPAPQAAPLDVPSAAQRDMQQDLSTADPDQPSSEPAVPATKSS